MKKNKGYGVFLQVIRPITIFQIILEVLMIVAMYIFTLYNIWNEKKATSQQISDYTAALFSDYQCIGRIIDYLYNNYESIELSYDEAVTNIKERELSSHIPGYISAEKVTPEQFDEMTDDVRNMYAEVCYTRLSLDMDKVRQNQDILYLGALVYVKDDNTIFYITQGVLEDEIRISQGGDMWELGMTEPYNTEETATLNRLVGVVSDNVFTPPIFEDTDEESVYTFAPVYGEDGDLAAVIATANQWGELLFDSLKFTLIIFVIVIILISLQLWKTARLILKLIVRPLQNEQDILNEYVKDKQSEKAVSGLSGIKTNNEIQSLAENFSYMAVELDKYTKEVMASAAEKERMATELNLATDIQSDMLPNKFPAFPERTEFDIYASMDPAKEVGGDFYDFFMTDDDHLAMVIADVSGKGIPAALFMMSSKILINDHSLMGGTPAEILERVNNQVCSGNKANMFVTVWLGILEISTGRLITSNAGHEYPMIDLNGGYEILKERHGPPIGLFEDAKYTDYEIILKKGSSIFVYTDGVAEATDSASQLFGMERALDAINAISANAATQQDILKGVRTAVDNFVKDAPQFDDITMLGLKYYGSDENK